MNKLLAAALKLVIFAALLLFVAGCASSAPHPVVGTWVTTVTEEEAPLFAGQWEVTFANDGTYAGRYSKAGELNIPGRYTLTGEQIVMIDESGPCVQVGFKAGTYKWSVENHLLTMTAIDDGCYNRRKVASGRTWSRGNITAPLPTTAPMLK